MSLTSHPAKVRHFTREDLPQILLELLDIHADAYSRNPDDGYEDFPRFLDHWSNVPGFACTIAYDDKNPVGFAYGAPATPQKEWWRGHVQPVPERTCTFSVSELMVRRGWSKTGTARRLHHALLDGRCEDLAVLLVEVDLPKVQYLYECWGYRKVGEQLPFPDSPRYSVMLAELPLRI